MDEYSASPGLWSQEGQPTQYMMTTRQTKKRSGSRRTSETLPLPPELPLELFNDRVDRIERTSLAIRLKDPNHWIEYDRMMSGDWVAVNGVTEDSLDAFVLNLRLLIQDGDGISLRALHERFFDQPSTPENLRREFAETVAAWSRHSDDPSIIGRIGQQGQVYTNGELFDILMYGGLAHMNPGKVEEYLHLTRAGAFSVLVFFSFSTSLRSILSVLRKVRELNEQLIAHIHSAREPPAT